MKMKRLPEEVVVGPSVILTPLHRKRRDGVVKAVHLKGQMDEIFLNFHRSAWRKTGQLNQFLAVGHLQKGQV